MGMSLIDELEALLAALEERQVDYALAGGLALAVWGVARATKDIDLLVRREDTEVILEIAAQRGFKLRALPMTFRDGMELQRVTKIASGESLTLDLLLVNANLEAVWNGRQSVDGERGSFKVVSRQGLIQMKTAANRPQDLADIERLLEQDR
jgi:hypothetical protein